MQTKKRYNYKRIFGNVLWALLGMATVVLLGAAINIKNSKCCKGVIIDIKGAQNNFFIDKNEVSNILEKLNGSGLKGKTIHSVSISQIEASLQKNKWIKNVELYFDNNEMLRVNIIEREPIARIFTNAGSSFYIDSAISILPLSDKFSARVPVFTNFSNTDNKFDKADSNVLTGIKNIGSYILKDPFWMAQIEQVDIITDRTFEMIPKVGNHIIVFGNGENYEEKFNNLLTFYKQVAIKVGWNKYSKINVQYKDQVVAVKRDAQDIIEDSLRAKQIMQTIVANAQKAANDSINNIQLEQTHDDNNIPVATQIENLPNEQTKTSKPVIVIPDKTIQTSNEKSNPALTKSIIPVSPKKLPAAYENPFWRKPLKSKTPVTNKKLPVKTNPTSLEKSHPIPLKKNMVTNPVTNKPIIKTKTKPKTETPTNDY